MTRCVLCGKFMHYIIEGSLEVKLPTIWTDQKAEMGRVREEERREEKRREEKKEERRKKKKKVRKQKESEERRCRRAKR